MDKRTRNGILFAVLSVMGYALLPIFTKFIYRYSDFRGIDVAAWRFIFAVPVLWLIVHMRIRQGKGNLEPLPRRGLLLLGVILATGATAVMYGLTFVDASIYTILFRAQPVIVVVINAFLGERFPLRGWIALLIVLVGVSLMVVEPDTVAGLTITRPMMIGMIIAFGHAVAIAVYNIGQQQMMTGHSAKLRATAWTTTGTLLTLLPLLLLMGLQIPPSWRVVLPLLGLAIFCTVIPVFAIYESIERIGASRFVVLASAEPLVTIVMAIILLGEQMLSPLQMIGGAMILASLFILEAKRSPSPTAPKQVLVSGD